MSETPKLLVKGFKYRIYPTVEQQQYLARVFGCCRYVSNRHIAENTEAYALYRTNPRSSPKPNISTFVMMSKLPLWKSEAKTQWLADCPAQVLQQACTNTASAYSKFFKENKGYPKFKKRNGTQTAHYPNQSYALVNNGLKLAKCSTLFKVKWHRQLGDGNITNCCVSRTPSGKYYASFTCEYFPDRQSGAGILGIDAGLTDLVTFSNGRSLTNPRHYVKSQQKLRRLQQSLSRAKKGSKNRHKARIRVARCHEHIANQRSAYIHALTASLIRENQAIGIERLSVSNMVKNRHLAKHIADAGWGEFRRQLCYKAIETGQATIVLADPYFPSTQLCSCCQHKPTQKLKLHERQWTCEFCGTEHKRDVNAARNLAWLAEIEITRLGQDVCAGKVILSDNRQSLMAYLDNQLAKSQ